MPKDQTEKDEKAFADLTAGSPFSACAWRGVAFLDGLAGKYPAAVDYYLGNGRERLAHQHEDLLRILDARDAAVDGSSADVVTAGMAALHRTLNASDPHYRYDFAVGAHSARDVHVPTEPVDDLVFVAQCSDGTTCVTWSVYARCAESVYERPVPITVMFSSNDDLAFREELRMFADYGKPLTAPAGTNTITMELPAVSAGVSTTARSQSVHPLASSVRRMNSGFERPSQTGWYEHARSRCGRPLSAPRVPG